MVFERERILLENVYFLGRNFSLRGLKTERDNKRICLTKTELPGQGVCTEMTNICHEYMKSLLDGSVHNFIPSDQGSPFGLQET